MKLLSTVLLFAVGGLLACQQQQQQAQSQVQPAKPLTDAELREKANRLAHEFIIVDTHVDVPYRLREKMEDISVAHSKSNHISDSSYDTNHRWHGLSPFGKKVVAEMNRLGQFTAGVVGGGKGRPEAASAQRSGRTLKKSSHLHT